MMLNFTLARSISLMNLPFLPQFEADRRAFIITINSFGTELSKEDRAKLFPHCGKLYPEGLAQLARADDYEQVKAVADFYPVSPWIFIVCPFGLRYKTAVCLSNKPVDGGLMTLLFAARSTSCCLREPAATQATKPWRIASLSTR